MGELTRRTQHCFQPKDDGTEGIWTLLRSLGQQRLQKIVNGLRTVGTSVLDRWNPLSPMGEQNIHISLSFIRSPAREQIKQRAAEAVDIGTVISPARISSLFWCHERGGAHHLVIRQW